MTTRRTPTILLVVLLVLAIAVGGTGAALAALGLSQSGEALDKVELSEDARDTTRKIICDEFNKQQQRSIAGAVETIDTNNHTILGAVFDDLTPDEQRLLDQLYQQARADTKATAEAAYPLHDCTPAGIAAYYEERQP